jgi:protein-S-isoprenylcysteine O-methyltransferase Ste14
LLATALVSCVVSDIAALWEIAAHAGLPTPGSTMKPQRAPILVMVPPPVQFELTFLAGLAVNRLPPWRPGWTETEGVRWIGWVLAAAGVALSFFAAGRFVFRRTTLNPAGRPARLVVDGAHAWSRNPMYAALTAIYAGVALGLGEVWPLVLVILPFASMNWIVIPFEESRLRQIFGREYVDYCRRVRRWI